MGADWPREHRHWDLVMENWLPVGEVVTVVVLDHIIRGAIKVHCFS